MANFVGKDRGYRGLSFVEDGELDVRSVDTVQVGARRQAGTGWTLALDADNHPRGWLPPESIADGQVAESSLVPGGSLHVRGTALRGALDAALSSPAGLGVVVDEGGGYTGVVTAQQVLDLLEHRREQETGRV